MSEITNKIYKCFALLLNYPEQDLIDHLDDVLKTIENENILSNKIIGHIKTLTNYLQNNDLIVVQENYVDLFDRGRSVSLHLFEHLHGESRDRGQAMVDLLELYKESGLEISAAELPDFLPLFLEFLSVIEINEASSLLAEPIEIISLIGCRLEKRNSPYAAIFEALEYLSSKKPKKAFLAKVANEAIITNQEMDKEWEEPQVNFLGAQAPKTSGGCGGCASSGGCGENKATANINPSKIGC